MNFSTNTRSSPKEDFASERARANPSATSAFECAIRMPLPPPPAEALIIADLGRVLFVLDHAEMAGHGRDLRFGGEFLRFDLVAHRLDRAHIRPDEDDADR